MRLGIANGRVRVRYGYACYGYTRGNGTVWHGGIDLELLDGTTFYMPTYKGKKIRGKVITARIVTDHSNRTWEWGYYICVRLDANQTPDAVNYLYFCHCSKLLAKVGDVVESGDALGVMGNTGNAALAAPPYAHVHFEVRATSTGKGLDPTAYSGTENKVGTYGETPTPVSESTKLIDVSSKLATVAIWMPVIWRQTRISRPILSVRWTTTSLLDSISLHRRKTPPRRGKKLSLPAIC